MAVKERGGFVTFEGGEGGGKSTQVGRLAARIALAGFEVVATREPGGSPLAERIRAAILSGGVAPLGPAAEAVMFAAARLDHVEAVIDPALRRGAFVISDRFIDSTRAYQGAVGRTDPALIAALEHVAIGRCRPDLTVLLDLPADVGLERARRRRRPDQPADRFEQEGDAFHQRLREAFRKLAADDPQRIVTVDAGAAPDVVAEAVWSAARDRFPALRPCTSAEVQV